MKEDNAEIYFLDECRFNLFTARDRGWAKVGNPASKVVANSKGRDVTLLAMIGIDGLANFELSDGYNAAAFTIALDRIAREMVQKGGDKKRYIVMDNCPIHNKENLHHIEKGYNIKVVFLPPYSPMLNPIENWFNELKQVIRQKTYKTRLELKQTLEAVLERYRDKSFANYYSHINQYLDLGIKRELER